MGSPVAVRLPLMCTSIGSANSVPGTSGRPSMNRLYVPLRALPYGDLTISIRRPKLRRKILLEQVRELTDPITAITHRTSCIGQKAQAILKRHLLRRTKESTIVRSMTGSLYHYKHLLVTCESRMANRFFNWVRRRSTFLS